MISDAGTAGPRIHDLHTDQLGTPLAMTSSGLGQVEWSALYRPFGEVHSITGTDDLDLRFPGQLLDSETGYHQNWHRDYDPTLGRYLQSDPIGLERRAQYLWISPSRIRSHMPIRMRLVARSVPGHRLHLL